MNFKEFLKSELSNWGKFERILFPLIIIGIICISVIMKDSKVALISAICGISYTILAGKGKISCYYIGLTGTICYAYLSFKNALFGNLLLYAFYYFPMQILGIFKWRKHLKENSREVIKTKLSNKERYIYFLLAVASSVITSQILANAGDATPYIDAITTIFSVFGLILTIKRCIEQWYIWIVVNGLSAIMWIQAFINGSNCFATILMWVTYFGLAFYFLHTWKQEIKPIVK